MKHPSIAAAKQHWLDKEPMCDACNEHCPHGTSSGWAWWYCRCEDCRRVNLIRCDNWFHDNQAYRSEYMRARRTLAFDYVVKEATSRGGCADYGMVSLPGWQEEGYCVDCWNADNYLFLDWDHLPGFDKRERISQMLTRPAAMTTLKQELAKCDAVCVLHHRLRTKVRAKRDIIEVNVS